MDDDVTLWRLPAINIGHP